MQLEQAYFCLPLCHLDPQLPRAIQDHVLCDELRQLFVQDVLAGHLGLLLEAHLEHLTQIRNRDPPPVHLGDPALLAPAPACVEQEARSKRRARTDLRHAGSPAVPPGRGPIRESAGMESDT